MTIKKTNPRQFVFRERVLKQIETTVGSRPAETGGMLGSSCDDDVVSEFYFDDQAQRSGATYSPDTDTINRVLSDEWEQRGCKLRGFIHSHPPFCRQLSGGDLTYARNILKAMPSVESLLLPIVMAVPDTGAFEVLPFVVHRDGDDVRVETLELLVVDDDGQPVRQSPPRRAAPRQQAATRDSAALTSSDFDTTETFRRVRSAYDLPRLDNSRLLIVGAGGAAAFVEEQARAGVGEFVLIDPDVVSETNLATQQVYRRDIGRPKVECLEERIRDINPNAGVLALQQSLDDFDDAAMKDLATRPLRHQPEFWKHFLHGAPLHVPFPRQAGQVLLCGLTDNFEAQARVNRLALQFGCSSLCAQVYREGRGAEITFTHPDSTTACHRCALASRYQAFLSQGYRNDVGSDGTPIFATTRLNATKGMIALALLHHGSKHPRWGGLLQRIGHRNLVLLRLDPDIATTVSVTAFDRVLGSNRDELLCDETIWLQQKPDCPENGYPHCPDCGGTGNLRDAMGTFADTRLMRPSAVAALATA